MTGFDAEPRLRHTLVTTGRQGVEGRGEKGVRENMADKYGPVVSIEYSNVLDPILSPVANQVGPDHCAVYQQPMLA